MQQVAGKRCAHRIVRFSLLAQSRCDHCSWTGPCCFLVLLLHPALHRTTLSSSLLLYRRHVQEREAALAQFGPPPTAASLAEAAQASTIAALQAAKVPEKAAPGQAVPSGQAVSLSTSYAQPSSFTAAAAAAKLSPEALTAEKQRIVGLIAAATKIEDVNALQKQLETLIANNS